MMVNCSNLSSRILTGPSSGCCSQHPQGQANSFEIAQNYHRNHGDTVYYLYYYSKEVKYQTFSE